jgi:preprotein translocase subunit SecA
MRAETVNGLVGAACPPNTYPEQWDVPLLANRVRDVLDLDLPITQWAAEDGIDPETIEDRVRAAADAAIDAKKADLEPGVWGDIEKSVLLQNLDHHWKEHLSTLSALREVIHLRAYAQKTPINEYKREAFAMFERMLEAIREDVTRVLAYAQLQMMPTDLPEMPEIFTNEGMLAGAGFEDEGGLGLVTTRLPPLQIVQPEDDFEFEDDPRSWEGRVSRNSPCPCGSGKKYKHCHGAL